MIRTLVEHRVAITSTLSVFEAMIPGRPPCSSVSVGDVARSGEELLACEGAGSGRAQSGHGGRVEKEMEFEREFAAAGRLLIAGCDPTGNGGALPGFGDQRNLELLVEAGFTPEEAISIYSLNGAHTLGRQTRLARLLEARRLICVVKGDPSTEDCGRGERRICLQRWGRLLIP